MDVSKPSTPPPRMRVAFVDRCVPHYRQGLYDRLMASSDAEVTLVAAATPVERIGTVPFPGPRDAHWRWIDAPGRALPGTRGRSVWQWGIVKAGLSPRYDAIVMMANPNDPGMWLCALAARLTGKRLIMWTHGLIKRDAPLRRRLRVLWFRLAHALALYGHFGKVNSIAAGLDPARLHVCYNSLDYPRQRELRESLTMDRIESVRRDLFGSNITGVAISLSRLNAFKKIDLLIRAHTILIGQGHSVGLLIVGDGPDRARLEALVDELKVRDSVKFHGECYDEAELSTLIAASDVSVTPGAIGLTVMHCLAYGVPCITHDDWFDHGPEFEAILPGKTGDFFRKDDASDLARVMLEWMRHPQRDRVSRECIAHVERFYTPEVQAEIMLRALRGEAANDLWAAYREPPAS